MLTWLASTLSVLRESRDIYYVYPQRVTTSFGLVAKKHIEYLRKHYNVREIEQFVFSTLIQSIGQTLTILHPVKEILDIVHTRNPGLFQQSFMNTGMVIMNTLAFYQMMTQARLLNQYNLIGFDVCDSDKMSKYAVDLINNVKKVAVPSTYCADVFRYSGVKTKIYVIPHGLDREWYELPNVWTSNLKEKINNPQLLQLYEYKRRTGKKILLFWQWYENPRKGYTEVAEVYKRIRKERDDVVLVVKVDGQHLKLYDLLKDVEYIKVQGWLSDFEKMALYDLADATLLFSWAGAFEINCLESLARGIPCLAHDYGSWRDYMHPLFFIRRGQRVKVFDSNLFHEGYGYRVHIDHAVAKVHDVLDNHDIYKEIAEEHRQKLKETFVWDRVGEMVLKMIND